jgi:hypothetical protein
LEFYFVLPVSISLGNGLTSGFRIDSADGKVKIGETFSTNEILQKCDAQMQ